jgi:hypothetical protein
LSLRVPHPEVPHVEPAERAGEEALEHDFFRLPSTRLYRRDTQLSSGLGICPFRQHGAYTLELYPHVMRR